LGEFLSAMLSLQSMTFLGFADDVFDIRWRYKLLLPTIASIPLLMVYYVNFGETHIIMPIPLRFLLGRFVDLGILYYVYMSMVAVFCTNSINILAGINGVEIGQSLIIACSIAINDYLFLNGSSPAVEAHLFSLYFILPFIGVSLGLFTHNCAPIIQIGRLPAASHAKKLDYSKVNLQKPLGVSALIILKIFSSLGLAKITELENSVE
ncbi:5903_t:CDS:2, partial [Scutellospora calospora]